MGGSNGEAGRTEIWGAGGGISGVEGWGGYGNGYLGQTDIRGGWEWWGYELGVNGGGGVGLVRRRVRGVDSGTVLGTGVQNVSNWIIVLNCQSRWKH